MQKLIPIFFLAAISTLPASSSAKVTITDNTPVTQTVKAVPASVQWEYKTEYYQQLSEARLNEFGQQGWELVGYSTNQDRQNNVSYSYVFKRPKNQTTQK